MQWLQFAYFFLCFFTDIMPWSSAKYWFLRACDVFFTVAAFPLCMVSPLNLSLKKSLTPPLSQFVVVLFWGIYFVDRELVYPLVLDQYIPVSLNHCWHTFPIVFSFLEALVVFHRYPSSMWGMVVVCGFSSLYIVWIAWVYTAAKIWPYPFFKIIPLPALPVFFLTNFLIAVLFQQFGRLCCYLRWKGKCFYGYHSLHA